MPLNSRSLLTSSPARRLLRPVADLVDRRVERRLRAVEAAGRERLRDVAEAVERQQLTLDLLLGPAGRGLSRSVSPGPLGRLHTEVAELAGDRDAAVRNVATAYRLLVGLESLEAGRIAGGTMNICGKLATVPLLDPPNDEVLEIGTLHGMFCAALIRMLERDGREPSVTIVDPFAGIQLQPGTPRRSDPSGTPVDERAVRTNLALAGPAGQAARIERGFSQDPATRAAVSDRRYGVIVVDGDHSAEGVAGDLRWAEEIAAPGGIVVLDDFGDPKWPGVAEALEAHLAGATRFTCLGKASLSAFLRAG